MRKADKIFPTEINGALPPEKWRPIRQNPKYYVSNHGRVRTRKRVCNTWLIQNKYGNGGNHVVNISMRGIVDMKWPSKCFMVSILVWEAFKGPIPEGYYVTHIGISTDDSIWNLRLAQKGSIISKGRRKNTRRVLWIDANGEIKKAYSCMSECADDMGYSKQAIQQRMHGKLKDPYFADGSRLVWGDKFGNQR